MLIFTNDDYRRIQAWLKKNAIKDSDFAISQETVPEEDILVITQNMATVPTNYKIKIKDLLNSSLGKVVINSIIAKSVKVNNLLTVDASNIKLDNEKGVTLQNILDYFEDNKLNRHTDDTFGGNLTVKKNITIEGNIKSHDDTTTVEADLKATGEITDGDGNILSDVNDAAKGWNIEHQAPSIDEPTVRAKYVLKDSKGVPKGDVIKVYKDSAITNVYLGTTDDTCNHDTGEVTKHEIHDNNEALSIVYKLDTGKYSLVNIPIGIFIREAEFDKYRGLGITENGQVFIKLASDAESTNYLHFNSLGELSADGIEARLLRDIGTLIDSIAGDGTMWGQYKKDEGTQETSTSNDGSRWGEFKRAEEIREQTSDSSHTVFSDNWDAQDDDPELPQDRDIAEEASYAYNWKTTDTPASDGKTEGNLKDLYQKTLNQDNKLSELESKTDYQFSQLSKEVDSKIDKNKNDITIISDKSDTFYIADSIGHVIAKIDSTGIHSPNINEIISTVSSISTDVSTLANLVASIFNDEVERTFVDNSAEFIVVDKRGNIGLRVSSKGVEGVFLNMDTDGGVKNDLRHQNNITPVIGTYGADNAVYKLSELPDVFRVAFDFRLNENINVIGTDKPFVRLVGKSTKDVKPIHAVPTDLLVSKNGDTYTAVSQVIGFNSGFNICGTSYVRSPSTKRPIVGDTAFSLWLKGNFNEESDFPTAQDVVDRASWLSSHSTAKIVFDNDIFSVQGIYENDINVSIKDGDTYKGLGEFYDELVFKLGDYFVFKKYRLSASKTTADLLQFGTLKLVSNYWQQTDKTSTSLSYNYDSFPVSIPLAIDETLHTVEIIGADKNVWVSVDGQFIKYSDTLTEIYIGGTNEESGLVTCSNLDYKKDSIGDAIVNNKYGIVSSRTPRVVGVMQHLIEDKYEGEQLTQEYYSSVSRMFDIFRMLENRGYSVLSLNDVCLWLSGRKKVPARSIFFLATTSPTYNKFLTNLLSREIWTRASIPLIIGSIINDDVNSAGDTDNMFKQVVSARAIGVDYITHLYDHDVMPDYKNSLILQQELYKLIRLCISCGIDTRMYSYGWSCHSVNYFNMLSLNGFIGAIGNDVGPSIQANIPYLLGRQNIGDAMQMSYLSNILI